MPSHYARAGHVCRTLGIDKRTLRKWSDEGGISFIELRGQRHYDLSSVKIHRAVSTDDEPSEPVDVIYGRVSTRKQKSNLQRQLDQLTTKYPNAIVYSDCASGLNFNRKGLQKILQLAFERRLRTLHITYKDRLCRFGYDLIQYILKEHGANIIVEECDDDSTSPERELADDIVSIITVFGARLHDKRSRGNRKKRKQEESQDDIDVSNSDDERTFEYGCETQEAATIHTQSSTGGQLTNLQDQDDSDF